MMKIRSKKELAVALSKLKGFISAKVRVEQYITDSEIAADVIWNCYNLGDLKGKIADLGAGTGILGIGALIMGVERVVFVESESKAVEMLRKNLEIAKKLESEEGCLGTMVESGESEGWAKIIEGDLSIYIGKADAVIMNPPFGTKNKHADKAFLEKAFSVAPVVYSFHKSNTAGFVSAISRDYGFKITHEWKYKFPLHYSMEFHRKKVKYIDVSVFRMEKCR